MLEQLTRSGVAAGIFWMMMATLLSSLAGGMVRELSGAIPAMELVFFRNLVGLLILVPFLLKAEKGTINTARLPLYCLRVLFAYLAMLMLFYALGEMQLAKVYALQYTIPLFTILCAVVFLKQHADARSWAACLVGFAGALVVMRPGIIALSFAAVCAIASALMSAGSNTTIKLLSRTESPAVITVWTNLLMLPLALIPSLFVWVTPTWEQAPWLLAMAVTSAAGGYCFTRSVSLADARVVQPFQFTRMIFATAIGYVMFAELPDAWTWVGAAIIFGASYYIVLLEARSRRAAAA
jgi:drug/metabolite transporter (DMT)-like permease